MDLPFLWQISIEMWRSEWVNERDLVIMVHFAVLAVIGDIGLWLLKHHIIKE